MGQYLIESFLEIFFLIYLWVSTVTTEEPVFSTALVMKDFCESILTSLNFGLINGSDFKVGGNIIPIVMTEKNNNCLWIYIFNFDFLFILECTKTHFWLDLL